MARTVAAWVCWAVAVPLLMRYELHTDDAGVEVAFLLLITGLLGFLHPRHAWLWAVLTGPCIPLAQVFFGKPAAAAGLLLLAAVTTAISLAGSYGGALLAIAAFGRRNAA
ncbi:MAG TPA: hypothetical protein VFA04_11495 [Bryobacteraceae bacterium]|nr:hypothetical protein [Bryobacteraceae bacterium]